MRQAPPQDVGSSPTLSLMTCTSAAPLASRVAAELGVPLVPTRETWFACGEGKFGIQDNVRGSDAYVFQSVVDPTSPHSLYDHTMMLLHAVEAAALADAASVTAVVPYYPCARQDKRRARVREGVSAGLIARCLQAAGATRVVTVEVHNEAVVGMFDPRLCRFEDLSLHVRFCEWLRANNLVSEVVAAPDVGGLERARAFAADLGASLVVVNKERDYRTPGRIVESTLIGDVKGRSVLLVDDIIDTAGTVVAAIEQLKAGGATDITVACAHPVLSSPALARLTAVAEAAERDGWRFRVIGTTSIAHPQHPDWYASFDLAPMIAEVVRALHTRGSVTAAHCR